MDNLVDVIRTAPLAGKMFASSAASVTPAPEAFRLSLRADEKSIAALSKALNIQLPLKPKSSSANDTRMALWLGPDEWLIVDTHINPIDDLNGVKALFSAVDVSHRNTAIIVSGDGAADVLNAGCPQDLSLEAFPQGACSRTILGKIEVVIYRFGTNDFRVECWRSFSAYAFDFLSTAAKDDAQG